MITQLVRSVLIVAIAFIAGGRMLAAPAQLEDFAFGGQPWVIYVPKDSEAAGCRMAGDCSGTHSGQPGVILESDGFARYSIRPHAKAIQVKSGERYRLSAWVKADHGFRVEPGTPGLLLRATLFAAPGVDYPRGHFFVGTKGVVLGTDPTPLGGAHVLGEWTKVEGVVEIPTGVREMMFFVFCWKSSGRVFIDQAVIEKVEHSTPLTTVLAGK